MKKLKASDVILWTAIAFLFVFLVSCGTQPPGADLWLTV